MSDGLPTIQHIDAADAFARTLFVRAKQSPSPHFENVALAVRQLHITLRHLRIEAADPDSLLNSPDAAVYSRQLQPIVEDCDFALKQLDTVLDKYGSANSTTVADNVVADRIATVYAKLTHEKHTVDMFLDTVQLHNPSNKSPEDCVANNEVKLEEITDKVNSIAARLFSRRRNDLGDDGDKLWKEFKSELEKEGFSPQVLRQHKDVLRAYIRELENASDMNGGTPLTLQGMLEYETNNVSQVVHPPQVPPKVPLKEITPNGDNEKSLAAMKWERRMPDSAPMPSNSNPPSPSSNRSFAIPQDEGSDVSMALISTRDLMAMDSLNNHMAAMQLQPYGQNYSTSPNLQSDQRLLTTQANGALTAPDPNLSFNSQQLATSPRYHPQPSYLPPTDPSHPGAVPRSVPRLAPDRYGKEIPMDAQWTRIKRTLVSPEVLQRAGVRYEARPDYVAVLGRLTREQINDYTRQSYECRNARTAKPPPAQSPSGYDQRPRDRANSKSSYEDDDDDSVLWDESDSPTSVDDKKYDKGTKSYPFIVNPPSDKNKTSPSTTVKPKPILKNKNENHVRFDPEPHETAPRRIYSDRHHNSSRRGREYREGETYNSNTSRHRDGGSRRTENRWDSHNSDSNYRNGHSNHDRRSKRDDERAIKRKSLGETLGAVGIGGAAVSLLTVLAEAAVHAV